uniref:Uncharacterized protein n=1 Tax=viral metagenome TaxID=1070528 RepID=A0A6H1ZYB0_9ZZZZ
MNDELDINTDEIISIISKHPGDEILKLADKAIKAIENRKDEDVDKWAERISIDVAGAND